MKIIIEFDSFSEFAKKSIKNAEVGLILDDKVYKVSGDRNSTDIHDFSQIVRTMLRSLHIDELTTVKEVRIEK